MKLQPHRGARQAHDVPRFASGFDATAYVARLEQRRGGAGIAAAPVRMLVDRAGQVGLCRPARARLQAATAQGETASPR